MKARDLFSKVLSLALVAVMLLGMLPLSASAAESTVDGSKVTNGMYMNKYTTLEDDGTYTITLEAFATGTTTTTTETQAVPMDIVVIVDQSGSMSGDLTNLKTAVNSFLTNIRSNAITNEVNHRVAIVGFASSGTNYNNGKYENTELFIGSKQYNYGNTGNNNQSTESALANTVYSSALQDITTDTGYNNLVASKNALTASGGTYPTYGFEMANGIFNAYSVAGTDTYIKQNGDTAVRPKVIVFFTDGEPGSGGSVETTHANAAINQAYISKNTHNATVYAVGLFDEAYDEINTFMNCVSSNLPTAQNMNAEIEYTYTKVENPVEGTDYYYEDNGTYRVAYYCAGASGWGTSCSGGWFTSAHGGWNGHSGTQIANDQLYSRVQSGATKYYMTTDDSSELEQIFESISEDVINSNSSVTLDETSVTKDIVEPSAFNLPDGYNEDSNIKTYTEVVTATETDGVTTYTRSGERVAYEDATIVVDDVANTIEVSNFDYAENFVAPSREGLMLIIEIKGIEVTDIGFAEAEDDGLVDSNAAGSGIYSEDGVLLFPFVKPNVELGNKSYVVDYAKQFEMLVSEWGMASAGYIAKDTAAIKGAQTGLDLTYGDVAQVDTTKYTYTPNNMNWDGFDTFYAFGTDSDSALNKWAKVNVIPANNVYYEDSFVTNESTGVVGIEYAGNFQVVGVAGNNTESANTPVHGGWIEGSLGDDAEYSDGTATEMAKGATATFTFTGTGLDIYSRTNIKTGAVRAVLRNAESAIVKYLIVDNLAESGDYYQIPTLSFQDLTYGTYTVELKVNAITNVVEGERSTYYLDGIRVYNPLGDNITDETVKDAYKDELNAVFTEVRDILIDAGSFTEDSTIAEGVVFLDDYTVDGDKGTTETDVGIYEDYGPKNEVYLAPGQAIAFKVQTGKNYYVGMKAPEGATSVQYTNGANFVVYDIEHSTDLYYVVNPDPDTGIIMIKNTDDTNILSITKLRTTDAAATAAESGIETAGLDEILTYASTFSLRTRVDSEVAPMEPPVQEDAPVAEPETEVEVEVEIEIENPDEVEEPETEEPEVDPKAEEVAKLVKKIFDAFRGWFGR